MSEQQAKIDAEWTAKRCLAVIEDLNANPNDAVRILCKFAEEVYGRGFDASSAITRKAIEAHIGH